MGSHAAAVEGLDFHPGLRVAFVDYCKLPVGQGRLTYDPSTPKLSQTQFIKLLQDVAIAEPQGRLPLSSISIIFSSFKPLGSSRMLFPHFFRSLGAVSAEAGVDAYQLIADLGSRTVDLQYLTSLKVFPDKAYPNILTGKNGAAAHELTVSSSAQVRSSTDATQPPYSRRAASARMAVAAPTAPSAGALKAASPANGAGPSPGVHAHVKDSSTPREGWTTQQFQQSARSASPQPQPSEGALTTGQRRHEQRAGHGRLAANHHYLDQWGVWEPPVGPDGKVPSWITQLLDRVDRLENEVANSSAPQPLSINTDQFATIEALQEVQWGLQAKLAQLEVEAGKPTPAQVAAAAAASSGDAVKKLAAKVAAMEAKLADSNRHIQGNLGDGADQQLGQIQDTLADLSKRVGILEAQKSASHGIGPSAQNLVSSEQHDSDMERVVRLVAGIGEKVANLSEASIPSVEGAITELASQMLELHSQAGTQQDTIHSLEAKLGDGVKRALDEASVDRTQLLATTSLVDQAFASIEQLKEQVATLSDKAGSAPTAAAAAAAPSSGDASRTEGLTKDQIKDHVTHAEVDAALAKLRSDVEGLLEAARRNVEPQLQGLVKRASTAEAACVETKSALDALSTSAVRSEQLDAVKQQCSEIQAALDVLSKSSQSGLPADHLDAMKQQVAALHSELQATMAKAQKRSSAGDGQGNKDAGAAAATFKAELDVHKKQVEDLVNQGRAKLLSDLNGELSQLRSQFDSKLEAAAEKLQEQVEEKVEEQIEQASKEQLASLASKSDVADVVDLLKAMRQDMQQQVKAQADKITELTEDVEELTEQLEAVEEKQTSKEEKQPDVSGSEDAAAVKMQRMQDGLAELQQRLQGAEEQFVEARRQLEEQIQQLSQAQKSGEGKGTSGSTDSNSSSSELLQQLQATDAKVELLKATVELLSNQTTLSGLRSGSYTTQARVAASASADAEAAVDMASALEDQLAQLERLVRGTSATLSGLEEAQAAAKEKMEALEKQVADLAASQHKQASPPNGSSGSAGDGDIMEMEGRKVSTTPIALRTMKEELMATIRAALHEQDKKLQAAQAAESDIVKIKVNFDGLNQLLSNHGDRLAYLSDFASKSQMAMDQLRVDMVSGKVQMLEAGGKTGADDTVASHAEVHNLAAKVQHMEDTLVQALMRMDSNIAQTALQAIKGEMDKSGGQSSSGPTSPGKDQPSASPHGVLLGGDGHISGGSNSSALKSLNPQRDKLAAAVLETDGKVTALVETVKALQSSQDDLKTGYDTMKGRLKELAEALVSLSNKAQARITKLESVQKRESESAAGSDEGAGEKRNSKQERSSKLQASAALKQLDAGSGQLAGMTRVLAKRMDDMEERLAKAEARATRVAAGSSSGAANQQQQVPDQVLHVLEEDVKGLGQDVVALHEMLQRTEAALRQAINEDCASRDEVAQLQQQLEEAKSNTEEVILKLAQQVDGLRSSVSYTASPPESP